MPKKTEQVLIEGQYTLTGSDMVAVNLIIHFHPRRTGAVLPPVPGPAQCLSRRPGITRDPYDP